MAKKNKLNNNYMKKIKSITCYTPMNCPSEEFRDYSELEKAVNNGWKIIGNNGFTFILMK